MATLKPQKRWDGGAGSGRQAETRTTQVSTAA